MESDGSRLYSYLVILVGFVVLKMFYKVIGYAIMEVNEGKIRSLSEKDDKYNKLLALVTDTKSLEVSVSSLGVICDVVVSLMGVLAFKSRLNAVFSERIANSTVSSILSTCVILLAEVLVLVITTEVLPIKVVKGRTETIALNGVTCAKVLMVVMSPFTAVVRGVTFMLCKVFKLDVGDSQETATEEEILMMVEETGDIEESQKDMINNIFDFGEVTIPDVMTHRKDITAVDVKSKISDLVYTSINKGFSRIPVYQDNIDNIIGIICVKDLLCLVGSENVEDFSISHFLRQPPYISEYSKCAETFEMLTVKKQQMAIVVDEYGGTAGLVTIEDLIEEIVGNIQDEFDQEGKDIDEISEGVYILDGSTDPEDVAERLHIDFPEEHNYDTMSAFIVDLLGHIPNEDEVSSVDFQGVTFTVLLVEDNWISKIKAVRSPQTSEL